MGVQTVYWCYRAIRSGSAYMSDATIEFPCVYCGQPVRVDAGLARCQIECPACGHTVRVRPNRTGAALRPASARPAASPRRDGEHWSRMSDDEIREAVLVPALPKGERRKLACKRALAPWLPRYDDLTLFAFALALVILVAVDSGLRGALLRVVTEHRVSPVIVGLGIIALGALSSLVNVFFPRDKSEFERTMMLFFAVVVTLGTGYSAGRPMLSGGYGLLAIFPVWNAVNGLLLLGLAVLGILDDDCLTGGRAGCRRIFLVAVAITLLIAACHYLLKLDPLTTFSIAVAYAMTLHSVIRRLVAALWVAR